CYVPEIGLVTVFCPLTTTGPGETVLQNTGESRFVADCSVKPVALTGHVKTTSAPAGVMASCGGGNGILNTVPVPLVPPNMVVPYRVLPDKIKSPIGEFPSPPVKTCKTVKPVPSVLTANTVAAPELPPIVVPYSVLPDKSNPATGAYPSPPVKSCRSVNPEPSVLTANTVPWPELPPLVVFPYSVLPDKTNPPSGLCGLKLPPKL